MKLELPIVRTLDLPPGSSGPFTVLVGLYDAQGRLPAYVGDARALAGTIGLGSELDQPECPRGVQPVKGEVRHERRAAKVDAAHCPMLREPRLPVFDEFLQHAQVNEHVLRDAAALRGEGLLDAVAQQCQRAACVRDKRVFSRPSEVVSTLTAKSVNVSAISNRK